MNCHIIGVAADIPGFGAVADEYEKKEFWNLISKVLLEIVLQLWLQASLFGLMFDFLNDMGRKKLLLSICFGLASAAYKIGQVI